MLKFQTQKLNGSDKKAHILHIDEGLKFLHINYYSRMKNMQLIENHFKYHSKCDLEKHLPVADVSPDRMNGDA